MQILHSLAAEGLYVILLSTIVLLAMISLSKKRPEWAGILSSFPTSVALILIFTTVIQGGIVMRAVALHLSAAIVLFNIWIATYYFISKKLSPQFTVPASLLILFFFAYVYQMVSLPFYVALGIYAVFWIIGSLFFYKILKNTHTTIQTSNTPIMLVVACAVYVACIVTISKFTSPLVTAALSAFPTSALFGAYYNQTVSKENLSRLLSSMYISTPIISLFCLTLSLTKSVNILYSFILAFAVAVITAYCFSRIITNALEN